MSFENEVKSLLGKPENSTLEYKAVLPPSGNIAQIISAFANTVGGILVLGVHENASGKLEIIGLSEDFHANSITHKALDLLTPRPVIEYGHIPFDGKKLYAIKVSKSDISVSLAGKIYKRVGDQVRLTNPAEQIFKIDGFIKIIEINKMLDQQKERVTNARIKLIEHYQSILKIFDSLRGTLYPDAPTIPTSNSEGKILSRVLFSSLADTFETYLSDLLYEIYLANPSTLKSTKGVTVEEVLNCIDLQEFIKYWAKKQLSGLQKGSVKGFIRDNKQIRDLKAIDEKQQEEIEKVLQIRHLFSHRNGLVDEKFLKYFPSFNLNAEFELSMDQICDELGYLAEIANEIDVKAIEKYRLAKSTE